MSQTLKHFQEITKHPRPSKKEEKIRNFLVKFFSEKGYEHKIDTTGNLIVYVPAKNSDSEKTVILQAHMDMVCVKKSDYEHDFLNDEIKYFIEDGWMLSKNTTLGADNGIGVALCMSAVDFEKHPKMELVFTIDEEAGMSGVMGLDFSLLSGTQVINLDSEDDDEICISSAGGKGVIANKDLAYIKGDFEQYTLNIFGLKGGHSGVEIDKNRGNAIYLFFEILKNYQENIEISGINSGYASNVIPSKIEIELGVGDIEKFKNSLIQTINEYKNTFDCPDISFTLEKNNTNKNIIKNGKELFLNLSNIKSGVYSMSQNIAGLVQTSLNLGIISTKDEKLNLTYLSRSSDNKELDSLILDIENILKNNGFFLEFNRGYFGWQDDPNSKLLQIAKSAFEKVNNTKPKVTAIHAGLECGNLVSGLKNANAISIGPNVKFVHSTEEKVEVASIEKMEKILENILGEI